MSDASLSDDSRDDRDLAFCVYYTPIAMARVGGVNESSLDGHYSESCEFTEEMIVHRKKCYLHLLNRVDPRFLDRSYASVYICCEYVIGGFTLLIGCTKDETCADG